MDSTPLAFYQRTIGRQYDIDNAYGNQCWDYMAEQARSNNVPWQKVLICRKTGYVQDLWDLRYFSGILDYYDEVSTEELQNGDFVIWPFSYSYTPKSHVAMYWNGKAVGQNQSGNQYVCSVGYLDFRRALGGFRLKTWEDNKMLYIGPGAVIYDQFAGQDIVVYGQPDGDKLTLISAKTDGKVTGYDRQLIGDIDDADHVYDAKLNANFFVMEDGCALGIRCGANEWSIPQQGAFLYYALHNDGRTQVGMDTQFDYYERSDIQFACSPGLVLIKDGADCEMISPETTWKRDQSNTQSLLIRTNERFAFAIVKGNLNPDQVKAWAKAVNGIQDLCFMDSGGSSCLQIGYNVTYATAEHRPIANALAFFHDKSDEVPPQTDIPAPSNPSDTNPGQEEPTISEPITDVNTHEPTDSTDIGAAVIAPTTKIDWARKLSSRKFWVALAGLAISIMLLFGVDKTETELVGGVIMAFGSVVAYILAEGWIDASREKDGDQ